MLTQEHDPEGPICRVSRWKRAPKTSGKSWQTLKLVQNRWMGVPDQQGGEGGDEGLTILQLMSKQFPKCEHTLILSILIMDEKLLKKTF